jgi:pimeloyl-ACP methyl ester carboxylesterase
MSKNVGRPRTHYAKSGDISIAYQVTGDGPLDLIVVPGWMSNVDMHWQVLGYEEWVARMTSFCRLIVFDKRGTGLSDRDVGDSTLEERMDDLRAVLDAVGSERAAVLGYSEGGPLAMLFAASYPERVHALVLFGTFPCMHAAADFPEGEHLSLPFNEMVRIAEDQWGEGKTLSYITPSLARVPAAVEFKGVRTCRAHPEGGTRNSEVDLGNRRPKRRSQPARPHARGASHRGQARSCYRRPLAC